METCPKCGKEGFEPCIEEVDIGVGVQTFYLGGLCLDCGEMAACSNCGAHDFEPCLPWCLDPKKPKEKTT